MHTGYDHDYIGWDTVPLGTTLVCCMDLLDGSLKCGEVVTVVDVTTHGFQVTGVCRVFPWGTELFRLKGVTYGSR